MKPSTATHSNDLPVAATIFTHQHDQLMIQHGAGVTIDYRYGTVFNFKLTSATQ